MKNLLIILVFAFFNPIVNYSQIVVRGDTAFKVDPITQEETVLLTKPRVTVRVTDTAAMLTPYLRSNIAAATYQAKGTYISASDTAAAFTPYLRSNVAAATYQPIGSYQAAGSYVNVNDTSSMLSKYLRSNVAAATYQPIGNYASLTSPSFTTPNIDAATGTSLTVTGQIKSSGTAGLGYSTGAGGTVTQATSKSTGVTLNKITGEIVLNAAALAAATIVSFTLTNSTIAATDVIILNHVTTGTRGAYGLNGQCAAGSAIIYVRNNSAASLSEAIVIRYAIIKGATN
jgi:hypothetical protein